MPAAAMRMRRRRPMRTPTRRMIMHHTVMAITITMTSIAITIILTTITLMLMTTSRTPSGDPCMMEADEAAALYRLMTWLSPSFPVGAFSYSSGIEWAVETGDISDAQTLKAWLAAMLADGAGFCDAVLLQHAWRAGVDQDDTALSEVAELAAAFTPSRERHLETTAQGRAFAEIARAAWTCAALERLIAIWSGPVAYPIAVGVVAAGHDVPLAPTLRAFLHAQTANWISAGV